MQRSFILVFVLLLASCSLPGRRHDLIPEETFASLYATLLETGESQRRAGFSVDRCRSGVDSVLQSAGVTREQFMATLASLNSDVSRWRSVSENMVRILEERSGARPERR